MTDINSNVFIAGFMFLFLPLIIDSLIIICLGIIYFRLNPVGDRWHSCALIFTFFPDLESFCHNFLDIIFILSSFYYPSVLDDFKVFSFELSQKSYTVFISFHFFFSSDSIVSNNLCQVQILSSAWLILLWILSIAFLLCLFYCSAPEFLFYFSYYFNFSINPFLLDAYCLSYFIDLFLSQSLLRIFKISTLK